jgi:hypothetical protein
METLENLIIEPALYQFDTGPEAQVGDQVKLFLNQAANPGYPEFIYGVIQHPITKVNCDTATSYNIEYDEADLLVPDSLLVIGDVLSGTVVVAQVQVLADLLTLDGILGILGVVRYADLTAANAALPVGSIFYDNALTKLSITTA